MSEKTRDGEVKSQPCTTPETKEDKQKRVDKLRKKIENLRKHHEKQTALEPRNGGSETLGMHPAGYHFYQIRSAELNRLRDELEQLERQLKEPKE